MKIAILAGDMLVTLVAMLIILILLCVIALSDLASDIRSLFSEEEAPT